MCIVNDMKESNTLNVGAVNTNTNSQQLSNWNINVESTLTMSVLGVLSNIRPVL